MRINILGMTIEMKGISAWIVTILLVIGFLLPIANNFRLQRKYEQSIDLYRQQQQINADNALRYQQDLAAWEQGNCKK